MAVVQAQASCPPDMKAQKPTPPGAPRPTRHDNPPARPRQRTGPVPLRTISNSGITAPSMSSSPSSARPVGTNPCRA
jgi:hypothetical protein